MINCTDSSYRFDILLVAYLFNQADKLALNCLVQMFTFGFKNIQDDDGQWLVGDIHSSLMIQMT